MNFGTRLRQLRRERDLTQDELAVLFNQRFHTSFSKSTISQYENGKRLPDVELLENWADFFDISTDYLLGRSDNKDTIQKHITTISAHRSDDSETNIDTLKLKEIIREVLREETKK